MPKLQGEDLQALYPKPKSFRELDAEHKQQELQRRPKYVAEKISAYNTINIAIIIFAYALVSYSVANNFDSAGSILASVSFSMLAALFTCVTVYLLFSKIQRLLIRAVALHTRANTSLILIGGIVIIAAVLLIQYHKANIATILVLLITHVIATYYVMRSITRKSSLS